MKDGNQVKTRMSLELPVIYVSHCIAKFITAEFRCLNSILHKLSKFSTSRTKFPKQTKRFVYWLKDQIVIEKTRIYRAHFVIRCIRNHASWAYFLSSPSRVQSVEAMGSKVCDQYSSVVQATEYSRLFWHSRSYTWLNRHKCACVSHTVYLLLHICHRQAIPQAEMKFWITMHHRI